MSASAVFNNSQFTSVVDIPEWAEFMVDEYEKIVPTQSGKLGDLHILDVLDFFTEYFNLYPAQLSLSRKKMYISLLLEEMNNSLEPIHNSILYSYKFSFRIILSNKLDGNYTYYF